MSKVTKKGQRIADDISHNDGKLTMADVWLIVDNLHTHFLHTKRDNQMFAKWMEELEALDEDLPAIV